MMKILFQLTIISFLTLSCDKNDIKISPDSKVKVKYIYSSSTSEEPYAYTRYTYDGQGRLRKELLANYPYPLTSSYTYRYDSEGRLWNKKYNSKTGQYQAGITEDDFEVKREYTYEYIDDLQIELVYKSGELNDSVVYRYGIGNLIIEEQHFDLIDGRDYSSTMEYDLDGNLVKKTSFPENHVSTYLYEDSKLVKSMGYDSDGIKISQCDYIYSWLGNKEIRESHLSDFISDRTTSINGNVIEYIRYHPTFQGSEWWCIRYEY